MSDNRHEELARRLLNEPPTQWPKELAPLRVEMRTMPLALRAKLDTLNKAAQAQAIADKPANVASKLPFRIAVASFGTAVAAGLIVYFGLFMNSNVAPATIVTVDGQVLKNGAPAKAGDTLRENEQLKVGSDSLAVVVAQHGESEARLRVQPDSDISVESLRADLFDVRIKVGRLLAMVPRKPKPGSRSLYISTPTTVASVRGTVFSVELNSSSDSMLSTYEGTVSFRRRWEALEDLPPALIKRSEILSSSVEIFEKASASVGAGTQSVVRDQDFKDRLSRIEPLNSVLSGPLFVGLRKKKNPADAEIQAALQALDQAFANAEARAGILKQVEAAFGQPPQIETPSAEELKARREAFEALSPGERQARYDELRAKPMDRETFKREATRVFGKAPQEIILKNGETIFGTIFGESGRYRVYTATEVRLVDPEEIEEILFQ
ncbi:MAG: FecR domain-containing protein [Spirochaetia bacterium]|nr:FecR domain-containing protein [Spirochaetia bacterium]